MGTALAYMKTHQDSLADEFDSLIGYRTTHAGIVQEAAYRPTVVDSDNGAGLRAAAGTLTNVAANLPDSKTATLSMWVNFQATGASTNRTVFTLAVGTSPLLRVLRLAGSNTLSCQWGWNVSDGQDQGTVSPIPAISNGVLHHLFITLDTDTGINVYVDGLQWLDNDISGAYQVAAFPGATISWSAATAFGCLISAAAAANTVQDAIVSDIWFRTGYIGDVADFWNSGVPPDPGTSGASIDGTTPQLFFGGDNTTADWNAATNRGSWASTGIIHAGTFIDSTYVVPSERNAFCDDDVTVFLNYEDVGALTLAEPTHITQGGAFETVMCLPGAAPAETQRFLIAAFENWPAITLCHKAILRVTCLGVGSFDPSTHNNISVSVYNTPYPAVFPEDGEYEAPGEFVASDNYESYSHGGIDPWQASVTYELDVTRIFRDLLFGTFGVYGGAGRVQLLICPDQAEETNVTFATSRHPRVPWRPQLFMRHH